MLTCSKENACDIDLKIFNFYLIEKKDIQFSSPGQTGNVRF